MDLLTISSDLCLTKRRSSYPLYDGGRTWQYRLDKEGAFTYQNPSHNRFSDLRCVHTKPFKVMVLSNRCSILSSTTVDKYTVIAKALEHFAQRAITIKSDLQQKTDSDYYPYGDLIFDLFEKDMALVPKKAYELIGAINRSFDHSMDSNTLLKLVKQEEKLISASLSLYRRDLEGIRKALEHRGLSNFEMPQIEQQITMIEKVVADLRLKLPSSVRSS